LLGRWGESLTADYLRERGYKILEAGWRCRFGELDLVASDGSYLCFVEVKLRKSDAFGRAAEYVDHRKRERLRISAQLYLEEHPSRLQPRFDVVEIYAPEGLKTDRPELSHWKNAF
jgi:TIGR00252 family protein